MDARQRVKIERALVGQVDAVGRDRAVIGAHRFVVMPAAHVDMRRHVAQMARVGHQFAQRIAGAQGFFRGGRHFHDVDVHVQHARMRRLAGALDAPHRSLEHVDRFERRGAGGRLAAAQLPQRPGRARHQRLGKQRADVVVVGVRRVNRAHRIGVGVVPAVIIGLGHRGRRLVARWQCVDQHFFDRCAPAAACLRRARIVVGCFQLAGELVLLHPVPRLVVVNARRIGESPVSHRAIVVLRDRLAKTARGHFQVETVNPDQAAIEPLLRGGARSRDLAPVRA